jgi:integrase
VLPAVGTAARPAAILELPWQDIDVAGGIIHLDAADREPRKKTRSTIRVSTTLQKAMAAARLTAETDVVIEWAGHPVNAIRTAFDTLIEVAELDRPEEVTPKTLRHTAATWLAQDGVPLWDIAHHLDHGTPRMLERSTPISIPTTSTRRPTRSTRGWRI